jgi:hypothetical protein
MSPHRPEVAARPVPYRGISILDAMDDSNLFARHFDSGATWAAWRVFLAVLFGLPLDESQRELAKKCTGREHISSNGHKEAWLVIGRRGGKSFALALIAVFLACFKDWRPYLGPGERGTIMIVAADRKQARVIMRYVRGLITSVPMLAQLVQRDRDGVSDISLDLSNRVTLEVHTASYRTTRGYTIVAALLDELAFWPTDDSAEPDREVINAIRPGMINIPGSMLLCASSPYARRGALFDAHRKHFGQESDVLVWQAGTRTMNPSVPQAFIDAAYEDDPASASAEYGAQFRSDVESYISRDAIAACVSVDVRERPPLSNTAYRAFVDPSGGRSDSMTLAVAHRDGKVSVIDAIREIRPPFSPESAVGEFAQLLRTYRITRIRGDRYGGEWPVEQFRKHGITYEAAPKPKSDLYRDLLPLVNSRLLDLLDHPKLVNQLVSLERRTARGGRDSIDHAPGAHDDIANAVGGVVGVIASGVGGYNIAALA